MDYRIGRVSSEYLAGYETGIREPYEFRGVSLSVEAAEAVADAICGVVDDMKATYWNHVCLMIDESGEAWVQVNNEKHIQLAQIKLQRKMEWDKTKQEIKCIGA